VLRGPTMVNVGAYFIDSTEVTAGHYRAFLEARGDDVSGQPSACSWNTTFWDDAIRMNPDDRPMTNLDWCDAHAFCAWAGKRLCGRIGGGAIPVPLVGSEPSLESMYDPEESQWYRACGGPNGAAHPSAPGGCNTPGPDGALAAVATFPGCEGYYDGVFDLEGNAAEWVDACVSDEGAEDLCFLMGGSYVFTADESFCDRVPAEYPRRDSAAPFGFRCCND